MIAIEARQQHYTKAPIDWIENPTLPENTGNPQLGGLARAMTTAIEGKTTLIGETTIRRPGEIHQTLLAEMNHIVLAECDDLIDHNTKLPKKEMSQQWQNIVYLAPRLFGAISEMKGINEETILNAARFSIAAAKDPDLMDQALFNVGIGGSDDVRGTQRLPAYALSMVKTIREIQDIYTSWAIIRTREEYVSPGEEKGKGLKKDEREEIEKAVRDKAHPIRLASLTIDDDFRRRNSIPKIGPTAEVFSGASAAAALNGIMDPEKVRELNRKNLEVMKAFGSTLEIPFEVRNSLEWPEAGQPAEQTMPRVARAVIDSLKDDLTTLSLSENPPAYIRELRSRGFKRGGPKGEAQALTYGGSHGPPFGDPQDMPQVNLFDKPRPVPSIIIADGSIREREYNAVRLEGVRTASPHRLLSQLEAQLQEAQVSGNTELVNQLAEAVSQTKEWITLPIEERAKKLARYGSVMRTMELAENPPYYFMEPVTVPLVVPTDAINPKDSPSEKVFSKTSEFERNGKKIKYKEDGFRVTYTADGKEQTVLVLLTQENGTRLPMKFFKEELADTTVDLDIPLTDDGIDSYAIARHVVYLEAAISRAKIAAEFSHEGDRKAIHLSIMQMEQVYEDYKALHAELHHTWYTDA